MPTPPDTPSPPPNPPAWQRWLRAALVTALLAAFVAQAFWALPRQTPTIDEFRHLPTGAYYWRSRDYAFDPKTPPLWKMALALPTHLAGAAIDLDPDHRLPRDGWGPWYFATRFLRDNDARYDRFFFWAHALNILAALALVAFVYSWAARRYGPWPALVPLALAAFSPTLLANSRVATADVIVTLLMALAVYLTLGYCRAPSWKHLLAVTLVFALALLTKFTATLLAPLLVLVVLVRPPALGPARPGEPPRRSALARAADSLVALAAAAGLVLAVINLQYGFQGSGTRLRDLPCTSRTLQRLQKTPLASWPLPLPEPFLVGFDAQRADSEVGEFPSFLNGRWSPTGWKHYYLAAFAMKEPLPFLLLLALGAALWLFGLTGPRRLGLTDLVFWYVPVTVLVTLSLFNRLDVGVRYLLPAYPGLWVACGRPALGLLQRRWGLALLLALTAWAAAESLRVAPHFLAYFNQAVGGPAHGYLHLIDSNLDHGQDLRELKDYLDARGLGKVQLAYFGHVPPEHYGIDYELLGDTPRPGMVAVSATLLQGQPYVLTYTPQSVVIPPHRFRALRGHRPVDHVGYSILIYYIPETP